MIDRASRLRGGIWGLLVGDATGVPYEFQRAEQLPAFDAIEMVPPAGFRRTYDGLPPGTWSDDGALALCLLASLLDRGELDTTDFGQRMVAWYTRGEYAVGGHVFDVGIQTANALRAIQSGAPAESAGGDSERSNGNGSLMRVLPLALWHQGSDAELVRDAHRQSRVTHGHARSQVCCALYCLWARNVLHEAADPWGEAVSALRLAYEGNEARTNELEFHVRPDDDSPGRGSGYVVDTLRSARWAVAQGPYEKAVRSAIALGDDTDTTACVTGGVAGVRDGLAGIPERWLGLMRGREIAEPLVERLVGMASPA